MLLCHALSFQVEWHKACGQLFLCKLTVTVFQHTDSAILRQAVHLLSLSPTTHISVIVTCCTKRASSELTRHSIAVTEHFRGVQSLTHSGRPEQQLMDCKAHLSLTLFPDPSSQMFSRVYKKLAEDSCASLMAYGEGSSQCALCK